MKNNKIPDAKEASFASGINYYKLFWVFFIACFLGVVVETLWCLLTRGHYESRTGLIYGPFNPVYGLGAVLMTVSLDWLAKKRDLWIFLGSTLIGGAFEYLCSLVQEYVFGTVSWEYSDTPLNVAGRTNLLYAFFWGILGLLWVKELYPRMSRLIEKIPKKAGAPLTCLLTAFILLNMLVSALAVARQEERREGLPAANIVEIFLDEHYTDERLAEIYPNMMVKEK